MNLLSVSEAAAILRVSPDTIRRNHKEHQVNTTFTALAHIVADAAARQLNVLSIKWEYGSLPLITVASRSDAESLGRVINGDDGIERVMAADHRYLIDVWSRNMRSYVLIVNSEEAED